MIVSVILADVLIHASEAPNNPGNWHVSVADVLSGKREERTWTPEQLSAIVALAISGDTDAPEYPTAALYAIGEPLVKDFQKEVRPIP